MIDIDDMLEKKGLTYDKLTEEERETYHQLSTALQQGELTLSRIKDAITDMKWEVEKELTDTPEYNQVFIFRVINWKHVHLKARLKNYMLIESLFISPERAEREVERQLGAMGGR